MQATLADETEASTTVEEEKEEAVEEKKVEEVVELDEQNLTDEEIEKIGFTPPEGFVDEVCVLEPYAERSIFWWSNLVTY